MVYHGDIIIDDAAKVIALLAKSYKVLFLTNNSTRSRADYVWKLERFCISCTKYQVITSGYASAKYIKQKYGDSSVYVIGENGLKKELVEQDIPLCEEDCDIVLVGLDKEFSYRKMTKALTFILAGAAFIATNNDPHRLGGAGASSFYFLFQSGFKHRVLLRATITVPTAIPKRILTIVTE
jgi:ribonucleotide monophosphatase NagD (HAD superfamily)